MLSYKSITNITILTITCLLAIAFFSTGAIAQDEVIVDNRNNVGDTDSIQQAIQMVSDGGTIIINGVENQDNIHIYEGGIIGEENDILTDGKEINIEGNGLVFVEPPQGQDSAIVVSENDNRNVTIEGIMFTNAQHAVEAKSESEVILENNAISSTVTDEPYKLNNHIGSSTGTGAYIKDSGTYHPNQNIFEEDMVIGQGGSVEFEAIGLNPSSLIYEQDVSVLENNPVTQARYERTIQVGSPTEDLDEEDDYDPETPFYSIQAAVDASSSGTVIEVYPRQEAYSEVTFTGEGVSGTNSITIEGQSQGSELPTVEGLNADYTGNYVIRDMQISDTVSSRENNANIDAGYNYWGSSNGPASDMTDVSQGLSSSIISEPYCTDESCEQDIDFTDLEECVNIETPAQTISYGCQGSTDSIDITINEFEYSDRLSLFEGESQEFREADYNIETDITRDFDIEFDVVQSDTIVDGEQSLSSLENSKSGKLDSQFSTIINSLSGNPEDIPLTGEITINDNQPITVNLGEVTLQSPESGESARLPGYIGETRGSITVDDFRGIIEDTTTTVSRFNADNEDESFQDAIIPPSRVSEGELTDRTAGTVDYFYELRSNPDRAAVIQPQTSPTNRLNVGMAVQGVPTADAHVLNITYALQAEDNPTNRVDVDIVDEQSETIYSARGSDESRLDITSTEENPYNTVAETENLETENLEIPLHSREIDFVNENGELYVVFENEDIQNRLTLLLYDVSIESKDDRSLIPDDSQQEGTGGGESVSSNPDERPGSFTVSFDVEGSQNTEYETYDVEPDEELSTTITFENTGDTTIEGEFAITDVYSIPETRYPGEDELVTDETIEDTIGTYSMIVDGGETETIPIDLSWGEDEFGNHTIKFEEIDDGEKRPINEDLDQTPQFDVYVLQPTTAEIQSIQTPNSHMTHDNFNSEIRLTNIGDLSGERDVYVSFGDWSAQKTVNMGGGNAREGVDSEEAVLSFSRDTHRDTDYEFTRREYTTEGDIVNEDTDASIDVSSTKDMFELESISFSGDIPHDNYRPNAPYSLNEGNYLYDVSVSNLLEGDPINEVQNLLHHRENQEVEIYDLVINNLEVTVNSGDGSLEITGDPSEDESTIYASAYPYTSPSVGLNAENILGETYVESYDVRGGHGTMFDMGEDEHEPSNRGATPLNHEPIDAVTEPDNRYFSIYYSHQNRYCNPDLLGGEGQVQVPEDGTTEEDTNVFLPFSADSTSPCNDYERFVSLQLPRFADTTGDTGDTDASVIHPSGQFDMSGVNTDDFEDLDDDNSLMFAVATVSNPNEGQPATARFEIVSDRELDGGTAVGLGEELNNHQVGFGDSSYDDNVVGVAAVELEPDETQQVRIPIVIKNDEGNAGEHNLRIRPRSEDDYLEYAPEAPMEQFEVPINVETYGDTIIESIEAVDNGMTPPTNNDPLLAQEADMTVNQVCRAIEPAGESRGEMLGSELTDGVTQANIIFNVDYSGSVSDEEQDIKDAIEVFAGELGDNYNYALSSFANGSSLRGENLGEYDNAEEFINTVQSTDLQSASNSGSSFAVPEHQFANYGDQEGPNYLIMLGDGDHFDTSYTNDDFTVISIYFPGTSNTGDMEAIADLDEDGNKLYFDTRHNDGDYGPAFESIQTTVSGGYNVVEGLNPRSGLNEQGSGAVQDYGQCDPNKEGENEIARFEVEYTNYGGEEMDVRPELLAEFESRDRYTPLHRKNSHLTGDRFFSRYNDDGVTEMEGLTWANVDVDGTELDEGESFTIEPAESRTVTFERRFQEPGLYHIRASPCRDISATGPQHYNLEGFTGVPDTIDYPTGSDRLGESLSADMYQLAVNGMNRRSVSSNVINTPEMTDSLFHGALGCTQQTSSVFVYDITNPVADFSIGHAQNTIMDDTQEYTDADTSSARPENDDSDFSVVEGGLLFLDASTWDCQQCYERPHFDTGELETLTDSPDFPDFGNRDDFRRALDRDELFSHRMSTSNTRIAGSGMPGEYPNGEETDEQIVEKGMKWTIEGGEPNYGQEAFCDKVDQDEVDQHCYMEQFVGDDGGTPDYYEVVPHRFTDISGTTVTLQVWDDATLTEGEANTNVTSIEVDVVEDETDPKATISHENFNDLTYDKEIITTDEPTVWHRVENVFDSDDITYRDSTPTNFENDYDGTYEGTRTCFETHGEDDEIGISQTRLGQDDGDNLDDGTRVIDDGHYVDRTNILNLHHIDVNLSETRDGNRRCLIFEETGPDNQNDREQTFEYTVYDYAGEPDTDETDVDVETSEEGPSVDDFSPTYDTSTGDNPDGADVGWIWAHNDDTDFDGDDVQFNIEGSDADIGVACLDVRLDVGSGPSYNDDGINENCQSMGDQGGDGGDPPHTGTHGNDASSDGAEATVGSSQTPGEHSSNNYFSASELGPEYSLDNYDGNPVEQEELHVIDWHGNQISDTISIDVQRDTSSPSLGPDSDFTCSGDSCGTDGIGFNSEGPEGGTHIVDAEIVDGSVSETDKSCKIYNSQSDDSNSDCSSTNPSASVSSFDQYKFEGDINVDVSHTVEADADVKSASCSGCECEADTEVNVDADAEGEFELMITDAHGNTETSEYTWEISDSDMDDDDYEGPTCPEDDD